MKRIDWNFVAFSLWMNTPVFVIVAWVASVELFLGGSR